MIPNINIDMKQNNNIIFMAPVFKEVIWGGNKLKTDWGYDIPGDNTGECWAISAHPAGDTHVINDKYKGYTLSKLWSECPELFGNEGKDGRPVVEKFPLLIKIIDAKSDLSIQVHPDDLYASKNEEGALGKTECWYVLDAAFDASLVVGHNAKNKEELISMIRDGRWSEFIREIPVKKGDFIQIEPGTVHSIKGGLQILETQQSSDITYRVYDYDRLCNGKPRELHIEKSIDVIKVPASSLADCKKDALFVAKNEPVCLISCDYYTVWKMDINEALSFEMKYPYMLLSVIDGEGCIDGTRIRKGDHFILPNGYGEVKIEGNLDIIASVAGKY